MRIAHPVLQGLAAVAWALAGWGTRAVLAEELTAEEFKAVKAAEQARMESIERVYGAVVALYPKTRQGGGSGVLFDEDGFVLTNNHVVQGMGAEGLGGLADGKLYRATVIGTDPGGDVALVRLHGQERWPHVRFGDSDAVQVGELCMAIGNPFTLAEDQRPTVTLGVVSGVNRYQGGQGGIGVYGNCIQMDSSINPGNSGGPLFDLRGLLIGINGRGSFEERGRVNVGLGYAISIAQIRNFLPELRAAKICQHGALDATFGDREGKVVCQQLKLDKELNRMGLQLGDELVTFDGQPVRTANEFANLLSTLPARWPVRIVFRHEGQERTVLLRLRALTYAAPTPPSSAPSPAPAPPDQPAPAPKPIPVRAAPVAPIQGKQGEIRDLNLNSDECRRVLRRLARFTLGRKQAEAPHGWQGEEEFWVNGKAQGSRKVLRALDGRFRCQILADCGPLKAGSASGFNGSAYWSRDEAGRVAQRTGEAAFAVPQVAWSRALAACLDPQGVEGFKEFVLAGADKTQGVCADRVRVLDRAGTRLVLWFSLFDARGAFETRALKIALEKDGEEADPQWLLDDYRPVDGLQIAHRSCLVKGLGEELLEEYRLKSCQSVSSWPAGAFDPPAAGDGTKTSD